ncbi:PIN domain-containing protein [bacterium]|nr:PIN domain-containing protein [bacterium]
MKLLDANLLLYAYNKDSDLHLPAKNWLEESLSSTQTVAFAWSALLAFVRITTRPGIFPRPLPVAEACTLVNRWLGLANTVVIHPGNRHSQLLQQLLTQTGTGGNLTTDAHLAALAIEHGATLCSCDHDFSRFAGLDWVNPLRST